MRVNACNDYFLSLGCLRRCAHATLKMVIDFLNLSQISC